MKTSSAKAKGRSLQKLVASELLAVGSQFGLVADDIKSTSMGVTGVDIQFSPAARRVFGNLAVECKNCEALNVVGVFTKHAEKYSDQPSILCHKRNRTRPMVTLLMSEFMKLLAFKLCQTHTSTTAS